ncbi:MAG: hypothetical protein CVU14_05045 [Bacteroidetes bacterium HGW-Bacteroidetes-9]|jgi:hypothetical protein|nr:MAG: hypothetical protein CVU14_05045 [Bacteroidetes bacterium HGW-Bacteroidetes-9]
MSNPDSFLNHISVPHGFAVIVAGFYYKFLVYIKENRFEISKVFAAINFGIQKPNVLTKVEKMGFSPSFFLLKKLLPNTIYMCEC